MLNKIIIPAALVATIVIAGIFAFMPVEKASTVHGTLATSTSQATTDTNVDAELDALDRGIYFEVNDTAHTIAETITYPLIPAKTGKTLTGDAVLTSIGNTGIVTAAIHECGLVTINTAGVPQETLTGATSGTHPFGNATKGNSTAGRLSSSILSASEGIGVQLEGTCQTLEGMCTVTIFLDS